MNSADLTYRSCLMSAAALPDNNKQVEASRANSSYWKLRQEVMRREIG